jgi:DNA-binding NarL/FixJ family response regulator
MNTKVKIIIAEDHTILRDGLRALLSTQKEFEVIGEAGDGREAIRVVDKLEPDLVLIDLSMPKLNGMEAIHEIKRRNPQIKVIALTVHKNEEYILAALEAGANGYVLKDASQDELFMAIQYVMAGKKYLSPTISEKIVEVFLENRKVGKEFSAWDTVTSREKEILKLIAEGYKNKDIADHLFISIKTVEKHRSNLMKKLDLHNTAALTTYAIEKKIV